ncbi:P-type conjugative transfer protein TrbL [Geomonas azotofigens]|uniref:P-type conjugative transfer protein TrbL n=1 Tax=Geomonas azotofigens TaxID=2843196 RepID=UPI001C110FBA|nr:P-type conjugative transfer protein TrbL [Geomonas azotofigens]MBU5612648.1 P-type conjugative transfer protein TrbL [Geomonas azotofigens]
MSTTTQAKIAILVAVLWLVLLTLDAHAGIDINPGVLDIVLDRFQSTASTWSTVISARASWLFWVLVTISMVWTFGMMALRKADIGEFFAEFIRFTVTTGLFWWLLVNGPTFARSIMDGLRQMASNASGNPATFTPSNIVDIGFAIFFRVLDQSSVWSPIDSTCAILISGTILVVLALVGTNMLILLVSGWILAYAGIFFLGFGGSRWTSDMAIGYFKNVLSLAAQLMTMVLLVGIGQSFVDQYYTAMSAGISYKELGVMLVVAVVLLALVNKVPPIIGGMAGGNIQALGGGFGAGAVVGAAAAGGAALSTAGAALAAGAANMGGGAQALMAAFSKANATESGGGGLGGGDLMAAVGNPGGSGSDSGGGSSLAAAMGDSGGSLSSMTSSGESLGDGAGTGSTDGGSATTGGGEGDRGGSAGGGSSGGETSGGETSSLEGGEPKDSGGTSASGETKSGGSSAAETAAKIGRVAKGTVGNLAQGAWDVTKAKVKDRVADTAGGRIAAAIEARAQTKVKAWGEAKPEAAAIFDGNSLSAGDEKEADPASEVAAFRDKTTEQELSLCDTKS